MITSQSISLLILLSYFSQTSHAKPHCTPSSCGIIRDIKSPFRLKGNPKGCGYREFELECENNVTSVYLNSQKYYVKEINYDSSTIRVVDASLNNDICSFPSYSAYAYNFTYTYYHPYTHDPYSIPRYSSYPRDDIPCPIHFISCPYPLKNTSLPFTEITHCASNSSHPSKYTYVNLGHMNASDLTETCELDRIVMTSWEFDDLNNVSLLEIHDSLLYGFELKFCWECMTTKWDRFLEFFFVRRLSGLLVVILVIAVLSAGLGPLMMIILVFTGGLGLLTLMAFNFVSNIPLRSLHTVAIVAPRFIIFWLALWLLIYKFRRRHFSIFDTIECFLQSDNKLTPIRYSYSDIKKMTSGFQDKLGEGGYGYVYKGKLRSGNDVAVKLLGKSGANGQDFMNEIATIGRIHHVNVIKLVGYCVERSKRALVVDFMPNGSLEKYIFNQDKINFLNWERKFDIAVGVARGIEYLHQGCDIQILHFDIKPHNILLDDKFIPKISDFGLAKFFSTDKNTVSMTTARGTIGYVAPELISRSIGAISYKADVYSFGMLLVEMLGLKRDLIGNNNDSSKYFPYWIYDQLNQGKDIEIGNVEEDACCDGNDNTRQVARKMTIVALWCIRMNPDDRPSMSKVLEMLEAGADQRLQIPEYPSQSTTHIVVNMDQTRNTCSTDSVPLLHDDDASIR